jgi:hypothetical protein
MTDPDPIAGHEADQLDAATRNLLAANGLTVLDRNHLDERWLATRTAEDLLDALLEATVKVCADGALSALVAFDLPTGRAYQLLAVRRAQEEL